MKLSKKILTAWVEAWEGSSRKVPFPRVVSDRFRKLGVSTMEVQEALTAIMAKPDKARSLGEKKALRQYAGIQKECEMNIAEGAAEAVQGAIFLLKSTYKYEDSSKLTIENENLEEVVRKSRNEGTPE